MAEWHHQFIGHEFEQTQGYSEGQGSLVSPEYSLGGLMLKLKLQYFGQLMQRADSLKKTLMLGKNEGRGRNG